MKIEQLSLLGPSRSSNELSRRVENLGWYRTTYLRSTHWKAFRTWALASRGEHCEDCGRKDTIEVHHKHYGNLWHERLTDVVVLCSNCHRKRHWAQSRRRRVERGYGQEMAA